jgi:hypothetical protein
MGEGRGHQMAGRRERCGSVGRAAPLPAAQLAISADRVCVKGEVGDGLNLKREETDKRHSKWRVRNWHVM